MAHPNAKVSRGRRRQCQQELPSFHGQQTMQGAPVGYTVLVTVLDCPYELLQQEAQRLAGGAA